MKKMFSLLLTVMFTVCAAFTCTAETETVEGFTANDGLLEWFKATNSADQCTFFVLQNDTLFAMQPDAQFTVYVRDEETEQPAEAASGDAMRWTCSIFTDADGVEHMVWTLPDMPYDALYLRFAAGAFVDKAGNMSPELCAQYTVVAHTTQTASYDTALHKLAVLKTEANLIEDETICYPQNDEHLPASYFSVRIKNDDGVTFVTPEYDDKNNLVIPAAAGTAEYAVLVCGQQVSLPQVVSALSRTEYEAMYKKDRCRSVLIGIALIPCLPLFMLGSGIQGGFVTALMSLILGPTMVLMPLTVPAFSILSFGQGAVVWWEMITKLIRGTD